MTDWLNRNQDHIARWREEVEEWGDHMLPIMEWADCSSILSDLRRLGINPQGEIHDDTRPR